MSAAIEANEANPQNPENRSTTVEDMWRIIYVPVINIVSELEKESTKEQVCSFLAAFLRADLSNILVPLTGSGPVSEDLQKKYTAYTTWLFGVLFHITGSSLNDKILEYSIEVQAKMLRLLSRNEIPVHPFIITEYLTIIDELLNFDEFSIEGEKLKLDKFKTERNLIDTLDLKPFPVTIKSLPLTQTSLLQIVLKSGVSMWDNSSLWEKTMRMLMNSSPGVKILSLKVIIQFIQCILVDEKDIEMMTKYVIEIVKTIPTWSREGIMIHESLLQYSEVFSELIKLTKPSLDTTNLCFELVELVAQKFLGKELEETAYNKIGQYLKSNPRSYTLCHKKFILYSEDLPKFNSVLMYYIFNDVQNNFSNQEPIKVANVSKLWESLRTQFIKNLSKKNFYQISIFLKSTSLLDSWLVDSKIKTRLYEEDLELIFNFLKENLNNSNPTSNILVFQCLIHLMAHSESNKENIQEILSLPWTKEGPESMEVDNDLKSVADLLDFETKMKCLETVCRYGNGKSHIDLLNKCISNPDVKFSISGISNCLLLSMNVNIRVEDILKLIPLKNFSKSLELQEAIAKILGELICLLSKCATLIRESWNGSRLVVNCSVCDKPEQGDDSRIYNLSSRTETIISSLFESLMTSNSVEVRLQMSKSFLRFSNHIKNFNTNKISNLWLPYIRDDDSDIRNNVGNVIGYLLQNRIAQLQQTRILSADDVPNELDEFVNSFVEILGNSMIEAIDNANYLLHMQLLLTAKNFACVRLHLTERRILSLFILTILHPLSGSKEIAFATAAFEQVSVFYELSPKEMYIRYRKHFIELMMEMAVQNYVDFGYNMASTTHRVAKCFGYEGSSHILTKDVHHAVSFLIPHIVKTPQAISLLQDIAEPNRVDEAQMLKDHFQHICAHAFLNEDSDIGEKCLKLVSKITESNMQYLMSKSFMDIFSELFLQFHAQSEKVIFCLEVMSRFNGQASVQFETKKQITAYLSPYLHGVLVALEVNIGQISDEYTQQCAIASLATLMRFMGSQYITPLRYKILATLRMLLGFTRPGFRKLSYQAWDAFLRNTSIEDLGPLLPTIFSSVVPLLESYPKETNEMLEYLIVKNEEALSPYIPELFFIEDLNVSGNISSIVTNCIRRRRPECVKEELRLWLKRIGPETDNVRLRALIHLQKFLAEHRSELNELILSNTSVHPLILELLDALMAGCRDKDEAIQLAYGECLGELGAVEPSLLPRRIVSRDDKKFIADTNEEFACEALIELARGFQMQKSTHDTDCFSLAIQEILKAYEISPKNAKSCYWESMPFTIQEMIYPFLNSHYVIQILDNQNEYPHPIYGTDMGTTFETWAYNWAMSMSRSIQDPTLKRILTTTTPAFKRDVRTVVFFIPHIAAHIVANGSESHWTQISEEMLTVITGNEQLTTDPELINNRPLRAFNTESTSTRVSDEAKRVRCSQVVFLTLEHLQRWLRERRLKRNEKYESIQNFCSKLNGLVLAQGCYKSYEYHRALMYLEEHMALSKKALSDSVERDLLAKIYLQLKEPDGVSGVLASQDQCPTLQQLVLAHEVSGEFQDAATCYEKIVEKKMPDPKYLQGMIQCYLSLNQPFTAMSITKGVLENRPELEPLMVDQESLWRLAHFGKFKETENVKLSFLEDLKNNIQPNLLSVKKRILSSLAAASHPGAYEHSYSYIMKLHILNEFEKATEKILVNVESVPSIFDEWDKRFQLVKASRGVEFVLGMRRATLDLALRYQQEKYNTENSVLKEEIGKIWLKSSKIARKSGLYQQAYMHVLSASEMCQPQEVCIEKAQLYWQKGNQEYAFATLTRCFDQYFQPSETYKQAPRDECTEERKQFAKAKLLFAKYNHETLNVDTLTNIKNFKEAVEAWRCWEKSYVSIAQYYESLVDVMSEDEKDQLGRDMQGHIINFYGKSLIFGCKYVHQSMPRLLTIFLEFASRTQLRTKAGTVKKSQTDGLTIMKKTIEVFMDSLPTFMWLTTFSQLVSRICHPSKEVQVTLRTIIAKLIVAHPQHCLWMMASVDNSAYPMRKTRCEEILSHEKMRTSEMRKLVNDFRELWARLIELSNNDVHRTISVTTVTALSKQLPTLLRNSRFSAIMMPTSTFRKLHLPLKGESIKKHEPFSRNWVNIVGIEEKVTLMPSLQRPRRITLKGSDGKNYLFMCKPKDDLRRDFRLMEFNDIVNKYLQKDPESRQRRLYIRTYSVVPLNEECGLIEWVPNLVGLRPIIMRLYKDKGILVGTSELQKLLAKPKEGLEKKRKVYLEKLLPLHPPVLSEWFRLSFPDPYGWYEARTAYIRTTAVMSMVGYILGLGDRHGENILFDSKCGDCVHVDFNCLFNRGEAFEYPERVPFRLTHNMVEAMGPLKYEGPFRRSCEVTMRVLREQTTTLISVLTPFVYDPLLSWNDKSKELTKPGDPDEKTNERAVLQIRDIKERLKGLVRSVGKKDKPVGSIELYLRVEGQTNLLILEATSIDNLCQMYVGWGPFL